MKTEQFLTLLEEHLDKVLVFEYAPNKMVRPNYHITEVKHIAVDSVDCGAQTDSWHETIIQLWESPSEILKKEYMFVYKALAILKKVGKMKPYVLDAEVKFEYGNTTFHTAQLFVDNFEIKDNKLIIKLAIIKTDCKAKDVCGVAASVNEPDNEPCCPPDGNCC
ncbi:MAG: DUF6428 family protein [Gelidibacter sp.]